MAYTVLISMCMCISIQPWTSSPNPPCLRKITRPKCVGLIHTHTSILVYVIRYAHITYTYTRIHCFSLEM
ncbi:hypothetical protein EON63_19300 [archaeon]|nr:MAG: hypothetical protein EON63_19300 [archaeon]